MGSNFLCSNHYSSQKTCRHSEQMIFNEELPKLKVVTHKTHNFFFYVGNNFGDKGTFLI